MWNWALLGFAHENVSYRSARTPFSIWGQQNNQHCARACLLRFRVTDGVAGLYSRVNLEWALSAMPNQPQPCSKVFFYYLHQVFLYIVAFTFFCYRLWRPHHRNIRIDTTFLTIMLFRLYPPRNLWNTPSFSIKFLQMICLIFYLQKRPEKFCEFKLVAWRSGSLILKLVLEEYLLL